MRLRVLLVALFTLIALVALAQNQPSQDQRIQTLEEKVKLLEGRLSKLESLALQPTYLPASWQDQVRKFEAIRQAESK